MFSKMKDQNDYMLRLIQTKLFQKRIIIIIVLLKEMNQETKEVQPEAVEREEENVEEPQQPVIMFLYYNDPMTGQPLQMMAQEWVQYFYYFIQNIAELRSTQNKNWKSQQLEAYIRCLADIESYIVQYVYTGQVYDYNLFIKAMEQYGQNVNKLGYDLYNHQCDYLEKKNSGHDFKLEKKNKKKANKKPEEQKQVKPKQQKPKEEQIIRKDDPNITTEQLKTKKWDQSKYANMDAFHLQSANLIFIGHVDSGKSTLTGNIMKQLKLVDEQQLARNKQESKDKHMESWELAYIADIDPSEREKGKTVECSKMMFNLEHRRFTLFDAPGHKNYVPSMIMGACQADIAVLIISAKEGEFQSGFQKDGQTKEHAMLAKALGVQSMIAVVTKMGTVDWSEARYNHIKEQATPYLTNACGFTGVEFIPIDSLMNLNIHSKHTGITWYKGPFLMEILDLVKIPSRNPDGPLRIPVIDKFRDAGQFYLYGKIQSGKIAMENQTVSLLPSRSYLIIKQIYNARDEKLPYALAGQNVKLKVKGIQDDYIHRGDIICSNTNYCQQSQQFKAKLSVLQLPEHKKILSSGYECVIHMHAISVQAQISLVEAKEDKKNNKLLKATYLLPNETGNVVIKLKSSVCLQKFDFMPSLGRFTLRDEGKTIGFGEVIKIKPAKNLTKQQKDQLGIKAEGDTTATLTSEMQNVNINENKANEKTENSSN